MASRIDPRDISSRIAEKKTAMSKEEEIKINSWMNEFDGRIGEAIDKATSYPITYEHDKELETEIMKKAWFRLADKLIKHFGVDKCKMTTYTREVREDMEKGDFVIARKVYGIFQLYEKSPIV